MANRLLVLLLGAGATTLGCGAGDAPGRAGEPAVRDSAGVRIVENPLTLDEAPTVWRVSEAPVLEIGVLEGPEAYQLFRVSSAARLDDGRLAVANAGTSEIRFFAPDGSFLNSVGRAGDGPGEYRRIMGVWRYRADSLLVWDEGLRRLAVLDLEGEFVRSFRLGREAANPRVIGAFADGSVFAVDEVFVVLDQPTEQRARYLRFTADGALADSLGEHPTVTTVSIGSGGQHFVDREILGAATATAMAADRFVVGTARAPEILVYSTAGDLLERVRWPDGNRRISRSDIDRHREYQFASASDENAREFTERRFREGVYATEFPTYGDLRIDRAGLLWVQHYDRLRGSGGEEWSVLDPGGRVVARTTLASGLWIFEIGDDYVLGVARDEMGVEYVRVYALDRAAS